MERKLFPTVLQISLAFLWAVVALLLISLSQSIINPGLVLWINELLVFTAPILWFVKSKQLNWKEVCRLKPVSGEVMKLSVLIGFAVFPLFYIISVIIEVILNLSVGSFIELTTFMETTRSGGLIFILFATGIMFLAPFFEELFFRGFIQSGLGGYSTKKGWILAGILFGVVHFGNGISNAIGAIFLGLLLSYIAYATESIWPTIIIHGIVNCLSAILIHIPGYFGLFLPITFIFSPLSLGLGTFFLVYFLRRLPKTKKEITGIFKIGFRAISVLLVSVLILGSFVIGELNSRLQPSIPMETSTITAGKIEHGLPLVTIEIKEPSALYFAYDLEAKVLDAELTLQDQDGEILYTIITGQSLDITLYDFKTLESLVPGTYSLLLLGTAEELKVNIQWQVQGKENN